MHYLDPLRYSFKGLKELMNFFESSEMPEQLCTIHSTVFDEDLQLGCAEYTYVGESCYHGFVLVKLTDDKISLWREYQHIFSHDWKSFISGARLPSK